MNNTNNQISEVEKILFSVYGKTFETKADAEKYKIKYEKEQRDLLERKEILRKNPIKILKITDHSTKFLFGDKKLLFVSQGDSFTEYGVLYNYSSDEFGKYTIKEVGGLDFDLSKKELILNPKKGQTYKELRTQFEEKLLKLDLRILL